VTIISIKNSSITYWVAFFLVRQFSLQFLYLHTRHSRGSVSWQCSRATQTSHYIQQPYVMIFQITVT